MPADARHLLLARIRVLIGIVMAGLVLSGATAIPLESELAWLALLLHSEALAWMPPGLVAWVDKVAEGLSTTNAAYPFMAYGTDWLAFGHFVIAIAFIGPWRDPVRNRWVIDFGLISCALVIPYAFVMGEVRGIPWFWRMIDSSFGIFGMIPLWWCRKLIRRMEKAETRRLASTEKMGMDG